MNKSTAIWLLILFAILSTGCSSITKPEQPAVLDSVVFDQSHSIGQTFVAQFDGMDGIEVYLESQDIGDGEIQLILRENPLGQNLGRTSLPMREISAPGYYPFPLPPQTDSNQQNYYLLLKMKGSGSLKVGTAPGHTYLNGALYQNNQPNNEQQMAFHLSYYLPRVWTGLLGEIVTWGWYLFIAGFLFIIPGWALMDAARWGQRTAPKEFHWSIKLTVATGVSLALYTILLSFTNAIDLQLGAIYAWLPPIIGIIFLTWRYRRDIKKVKLSSIQFTWVDLNFIAIILIIFAARFWIIRAVPVPLWGDSQQHAMITQLILDNAGLFSSWQPYEPYYSLTTHFGFSASSALFAWITGLNGTQATLWMGQILNGLAILTLYPLAVKISRGNRWAGTGTLIVSGLIFSLPAFYVNWGRFAQLSGQVILPIALWLLWESIDREKWLLRTEWLLLLLSGMTVTGMTLSYYRMPFYFATFIPILLIFWGLPKWHFNLKNWGNAFLRILLIGLICIIFFIPWGMRLTGSRLASAVEAGVTGSTSASRITADLNCLKVATEYIPGVSLALAGIVIIWALIRKNWFVAALPLWFVLLLGYRIGAMIQLPGANMLQVFAVIIALYIPLGLLLGWFFGEVMNFISKPNFKWMLAVASLFIVSFSGWLGWQQRLILNQNRFALVTHADLKAFSWIEKEIPTDAQLLIQGFEYRGTAAGSDAGWWLPLSAERNIMIPPQYAQFNEVSQPPDYTQRVVELVSTLENHSINEPESFAALCNWGITHIYHGQGQGKVGGPPLFSTDDLLAAPQFFSQIYHEDRVFVFEFNAKNCDQLP